MSDVRLDRVGKAYGKHRVFFDLDLHVRDGECFTLLGPSGCGKTVILRLIAGFEQPGAGRISIGNNLVSSPDKGIHVPPELRNIGVVFQDYAVWPHRTMIENVVYPLTIRKVPRPEASRRAMEAIRAVNLSGLENRLPYQLSGGQQQRVALARALVSEPEIMLLDEPLCNLDANLREEMRFEIKQLQMKTGVTIFYVTHDQEVALAISDRIAIMDGSGNIRQIGPPEKIFEKPADSFVFQFMGVSNFLPVERLDGRIFFKGTSEEVVCEACEAAGGGENLVAAFRPSDAELTRNGTGVGGTIKRKNFLGPLIDYRIAVAGREVRVQQNTREALEKNLLFDEGERCGIRFRTLIFYDSASLNG